MPRARSSTRSRRCSRRWGRRTRRNRSSPPSTRSPRATWASACGLGGWSPEPGRRPGSRRRQAGPSLPALPRRLSSPRRCGFRGGYVEVVNMDAAVKQQMQKLRSVRLCPPTPGQVLLDVAVSPPAPSDPSFPRFQAVSGRGHGRRGACAPAWLDQPYPLGSRRGGRCWPSWLPRPSSRSRSSTKLPASAAIRCRAPCIRSRACSCPRVRCSALRSEVRTGRPGRARGAGDVLPERPLPSSSQTPRSWAWLPTCSSACAS